LQDEPPVASELAAFDPVRGETVVVASSWATVGLLRTWTWDWAHCTVTASVFVSRGGRAVGTANAWIHSERPTKADAFGMGHSTLATGSWPDCATPSATTTPVAKSRPSGPNGVTEPGPGSSDAPTKT